ncbi:uncharacterized protein LOC115950612 isoform X1 [Quercus lobata]|uniref:RING-type domain-containing protein n=1 Tax=Quercus lobata TaxID=97700 RepID=A0A7N2LX79_QUELO|nr:uncharacterized protein LOC115950612 isoform X1 [Quercus lobata]
MANNASGESSSSIVRCTVCLDEVSDFSERTAVKLRCSHVFHLDCIGSAFNVKGAMQCPNCREVESGVWRCFGDEGPEQTIDQETNDEVADEFDMPANGIQCPLGWVVGLPSPWNPNAMGRHGNGFPNIDLVADPVILDHRTHAQTSVDTSIGFANQHSNDQVYQSFHWMQPLSNSPSPVVRASMSPNRRRSNRLRGRLPAGETASSLEETRNSNPEHLANLTEQDLQAQADFTAYELLLERIKNERFFPDCRDPSSDA